jgi:hypothetical protein
MRKRVVRCTWLGLLGFALAFPLAGCQQDNEGEVDTGKEGTANLKYSSDDPGTYQAYHKDQQKTLSEAKTAPKKR